MQILEHGQENERTLLFFPCTAEPVWVFENTAAGCWRLHFPRSALLFPGTIR